MKVFISWSGTRSNAIAQFLSEWLQCVIQNCRPWVSSHDIDAGSIWFNEINEALQDSKLGIVCLTQDNKDNPWILFESGALARGISTQRVCTFLADLKPSDIRDPLAQFNHTTPEEESMKKLVRLINSLMGDYRINDRVLDKVFTQYWTTFSSDFQSILGTYPESPKAKPRKEAEIMEEILGTVRRLDHRIQQLESKSPPLNSDTTMLGNSSHHVIQSGPAFSPPVTRSKIRQMVAAGLSTAEIQETFSKSGTPPEVIHTLVKAAKRNFDS